nr:reverse transcriptase domain-containing protein [Tanacetum cinerariifolium]
MRTLSSSNLVGESSPNPTTSNPKRHNRRRSKQPFIFEESTLDTMADQRTMAKLLHSPTEGYAEAIVVPPILAEHFELKHSLINMMTSEQFFRLKKDNPHDHIRWFNKITSTIKYKDVPNLEDLVSKFISEFFPPSRTTNLRNEISNFQQRLDESFHDAWEHYKDLLRACPHHSFTELHQLDTFYNALNRADQDSLNSAAGGNLLERRTQDVFTIIENKSKVRNSRNKSIGSQVKSCVVNSSSSPEIAKLTHEVNHGAHPYYQCLAADGNTFPEFLDNIQGYVSAAAVNYNQAFFQMSTASTSSSGPLPSNTIANPKGELKAITTRSGLVLDGPSVPMPPPFINSEKDERADETLTNPKLDEYTIKVPPPLVQKSKSPSIRNYVVHQRDPHHPHIPYPLRMNQQKQQEKDEIQIHKFWKMFKQLYINITLADALFLIPKYQKMLKALFSNKEKLLELANTPLDENCSVVILKKLPEKLGDPGKFLIPCGFSELKCKALADLGASINLMPLSI